MMLTFTTVLKDQLGKQKPVVTADLTGKTVIVLGANTGLGFEATKHFATMNAGRLILACRSQSRGQAAVEKLKVATGYARAELWLVDLADFASVRQFGDRFEREGGRLDILVQNAAMAVTAYEPTKDGWESSIQVNNLAPSLLALLLLPAMLRTAKEHSTAPRIVVVASDFHYWAEIDKNIWGKPGLLKTAGSKEYCTPKNMSNRYPVTKLFNVLFVRALNAHLGASTPLVVDAVDPGYCYSELRRELKGVRAMLDRLMERAMALTTEKGSRQLVFAALAHQDRLETLRGAYVSAFTVREVSDFVLSPEGVKAQKQFGFVKDEMVEILGKVDPRVTTIVQQYLSSGV